ncbi:hypothetical protein ACH347_43765 [Saccharopolyspora sp. 5N102]|uniref:hypothetical protein n=1 Tax=Saccharopolyspora sp. 5N102 TaxID=3375155 RepID=UPI0037BBC1FB
MTAAHADPVPTLFPLARSGELARDIEAVALSGDAVDAGPLWTRPGLLRRVAAQVAETLPAGVDRVVGHEQDLALLVAVSLHSGVPYAAVDHDQGIRGELYPAETVLVARTCSSSDGTRTIKAVLQQRVRVAKVVTAIEVEPPADLPSAIHHCALFRLRDGRLHPGDEQ